MITAHLKVPAGCLQRGVGLSFWPSSDPRGRQPTGRKVMGARGVGMEWRRDAVGAGITPRKITTRWAPY